ncbi:hypothetical protein L0F63_006716 [Massospora cicadina]|nr:hypothetical protein L0F63_006716 [Massospora cicadina]
MTTFCPTAYGVSSEVGKRPSQQDDFLIQEDIFGDKEHYLYAVFDGHGEQGDKVSKAVKIHLSKIMPGRKDAFVRDSRQAMIDVFQDISEMLGVDPDIDIYMSGTTAAVAIVTPTKVVAANLGDCRIVVGQKISELPVPSEEHQILYRPLVLTR